MGMLSQYGRPIPGHQDVLEDSVNEKIVAAQKNIDRTPIDVGKLVEAAANRVGKLDDLEIQTELMMQEAQQFEKRAGDVEQQEWLLMMKTRLLVGTLVGLP